LITVERKGREGRKVTDHAEHQGRKSSEQANCCVETLEAFMRASSALAASAFFVSGVHASWFSQLD
jgi:hypothetical protein